jgi:hypothetical protein
MTSTIRGFAIDDRQVFVSIADNSGTGTISAAAKDGTELRTIRSRAGRIDPSSLYWHAL